MLNGKMCHKTNPLECRLHSHFGQGLTAAQMREFILSGATPVSGGDIVRQMNNNRSKREPSRQKVEEKLAPMTAEELATWFTRVNNRKRREARKVED